MRNLWIMVAAILFACCQAKAGGETENLTEGDTLYTSNLQENIKDVAISVPRGGDAPDIVTLLTAFNHAYPTGDLSYVLDLAKDPKFTRSEENEYGGYDVVDRKNGYVGTDITSGADGSYMDAALWKRNDGHRLLILHFGQPTDPEIDYVICYDYDPAKQQMTLDKAEAEALKPLWPANKQFFSLPQKGKDIQVREWSRTWWRDLNNTYTWNGQYHEFAYTESEVFEELMECDNLKSNWGLMWENFEDPKVAEYALVDLDDDENPEIILCEATDVEDHTFQNLYTYLDGEAEDLGCTDRSHEFHLKKNGCILMGNADVGMGLDIGSHAAEYTVIKNSRFQHHTISVMRPNEGHTDYDEDMTDGEKPISEKEFERLNAPLEERNYDLVWRKVK